MPVLLHGCRRLARSIMAAAAAQAQYIGPQMPPPPPWYYQAPRPTPHVEIPAGPTFVPTPPCNIHVSPDAFGAGVGRAMSQFGKQLNDGQ